MIKIKDSGYVNVNELEKIFDSTKMIKLQKINYETLGSDEPALIIDN